MRNRYISLLHMLECNDSHFLGLYIFAPHDTHYCPYHCSG